MTITLGHDLTVAAPHCSLPLEGGRPVAQATSIETGWGWCTDGATAFSKLAPLLNTPHALSRDTPHASRDTPHPNPPPQGGRGRSMQRRQSKCSKGPPLARSMLPPLTLTLSPRAQSAGRGNVQPGHDLTGAASRVSIIETAARCVAFSLSPRVQSAGRGNSPTLFYWAKDTTELEPGV